MKHLWVILLLVSCTTAPKITYEGERNQEGEYHGKGVITYPNGEKYVGEWKNGKRNGQGTATFPTGEKYVGEFKDNKRNGQGIFTYLNGEVWEGEFKDNNPYNGQGTATYPDGAKYVGEWKNGKRNGQGTYTYPDGGKYVGEWKDGQWNGKGVYFKPNGEIQSGTWLMHSFENVWTIEAVDNFLKNKYPQYKGLNYSGPSVSSLKNDITELPPPPETLTNIAVIDFIGNNISDGEVKALTDRLRVELFKTKYFKVIEREMMEEVLKEQGFQQSGCSTDECMVQIGRLIGVQKIIGGSISKVGNIYSVSSRIVNVETGEIEKTEVYDHIGDIGQLLTNGMREVTIGLIK